MKWLKMIFYLNIALIVLVGCSNNTNEQPVIENESERTNEIEESNSDNEESVADSDHTDTGKSDLNQDEKEDEETLSQYSHQQIEYARIWLQLGPNQELDGFYVRHIPAGEPLNSNDETSASYPEDVIQLSGTRQVDGAITYSGNGDGTINIYKIPLRWEGVYPAGEEFYLDMIENVGLVKVEPGDDEEIIAFIKQFDVGD